MKNVGPCYTCKCEMWIPDHLYASARESEKIHFYCAYGHSQYYPQGESETTKLRRDRDQLAQRIAQRDDRIRELHEEKEQTEKRLSATRGVVTRIKNRIGHGVCPCCNRTFGDLHRHMATKHPTYSTEAAE